MLYIAIKNLLHDRVRFAIALTGVTIAVILIASQVGLFMGFRDNSAIIVDHTDADIWVTSKNSRNFDFSQPFTDRKLHQVLRVPGVASAEKLILGWGVIKNPDGGSEQVEVIGYNPDTGIGGPWAMREGSMYDVKGGLYAIMDDSAEQRLGEIRVGDYREVLGQRLKIIGLSHGARSFTTAPFVFVSYSTAQQVIDYLKPGDTVFILVRVAPGVNSADVAAEIRQTVDYVDVYTKQEYSAKTKEYWMFETGVGFGFMLTMVMALIIGFVIVGQTIYSSTVDHLKEYGTLKAIGAENSHIYSIIFNQALVNAVCGYAIGAGVTLLTKDLYEKIGAPVLLNEMTMVAILFATFAMCLTAAFISVWKAMRLEPAQVFR
jgi:putative ABC transport system permease protein